MRERLLLVFLPHLLLGCLPNEEPCTPVAMSSAGLFEAPAASYAIPRERPTGQLSVTALGVGGSLVRMRMTVSNFSGSPWMVRPSEQRMMLDAVSLNGKQAPSVAVISGQTRTVDVEFTVPANIAMERAPVVMDAIWTVHIGPHVISERTVFDRLSVAE